jgi:hypothetical protein
MIMKEVTDTKKKLLGVLYNANYKRELGALQKKRRIEKNKQDNKHNENIKILQELYYQTPKARASYKELHSMIAMVLETGDSGTKVIRRYAEENEKDKQWRKEIARQRAGKLFDTVISEYEEHPLIVSMKESKKYCKKDVLNNSVTGALKKLAKQISDHMELVDKDNQIAERDKKLAIKESFAYKEPNWTEAQKLRDNEWTIRDIAEVMGVSKSTVQKYTKRKSKG